MLSVLSPHGSASPRDFEFVKEVTVLVTSSCQFSAPPACPACMLEGLGRSGLQLEVWGLGAGEMKKKKKRKTAGASFSLVRACLLLTSLRH